MLGSWTFEKGPISDAKEVLVECLDASTSKWLEYYVTKLYFLFTCLR